MKPSPALLIAHRNRAAHRYLIGLLFLSGCFKSDILPRNVEISCLSSLDCPSRSVCIEGLCYTEDNDCILQGQGSPAFAPAGAPCQVAGTHRGEGICVQGACTTPFCGDGVVTAPESCAGTLGCRTDCTTCGDGTIDENNGELCDDGSQNSDERPGACRTNCTFSSCGDSVQDPGEGCDEGETNSDSLSDGCRLDCKRSTCGDGVIDSSEECDSGAGNSDIAPDACRRTCMLPSCGDGIVDSLEDCDDGKLNSDVQPVSCRTTCRF
ncbi:MAG: DUF4215 domain-containing protein, partial [Myxococcota bacterium]